MRQVILRLAERLRLDRLAYLIWRYNPRGLYRLYQHHEFDRRFNVETRGYVDLRYEPTPAPVLAEILDSLDLDFTHFLFIDIGSGKGKVLLLASAYPFRKIIGIECYPDLHEIALQNLSACSLEKARCSELESICVDAANYAIPPEPTVFYFFNPFAEEILARVLSNIEASLVAHPRPAFIIYYAPILKRGSPWDRRRLFDSSKQFQILRDERTFTVYASV